MPGKLIAFILTLLVIITFIGFNIENSSDIRFWFGEKGVMEDVPIFVSFFFMYLIGVLSVIPFLFSWRRGRMKKEAEKDTTEEVEDVPGKKRNRRVLGGKKKGDRTEPDIQIIQEEAPDEPPAGEIPSATEEDTRD